MHQTELNLINYKLNMIKCIQNALSKARFAISGTRPISVICRISTHQSIPMSWHGMPMWTDVSAMKKKRKKRKEQWRNRGWRKKEEVVEKEEGRRRNKSRRRNSSSVLGQQGSDSIKATALRQQQGQQHQEKGSCSRVLICFLFPFF